MPFVKVEGSAKLNWDITYDRYDPKTGDKMQDGNGLKPLDLTDGEHFDFNPNGAQMKEYIWRGQPNQADMNWNEMPVYRVLTNRFKSGFSIPRTNEERNKTDWGRFMRDYEREVARGGTTYYEPHIDDVRVDPELSYHFPLWVIDKLIEMGQFNHALTVGKVNLPGVKRLTKTEYDRIMKEVEIRKEQESPKKEVAIGNVSPNIKSSKG